jgi:uncharacterized protein
LKRRGLLGAMAAVSASTLTGCPVSFEQGLFSECRNPLPAGGARLLVAQAWSGIRADNVWDVHAHLVGDGRGGSGIYLHPSLDRPWLPAGYVRRKFFLNALCVGGDDQRMDQAMVARLAMLADTLPPGVKLMLLAFDYSYDEGGKRREDWTTFAIPNEYAARVAASRKDRFEWIASVHPYRADAVQALEAAKAAGARALKWLPPSMGIDLASARCKAFYETLRRLDLPLLTHVGEEQAVAGAEKDEYANPLLLKHPLEAGVRVIAAHCATLGEGSFEKFGTLMDDPRYEKLLFADISAITQLNRLKHLPAILERKNWHPRLLNGSDYPLPGMKPIFSLKELVKMGLLDGSFVPALRDLRESNALLFDFVLKRNLSSKGSRFPASVFETRKFFETAPLALGRGAGKKAPLSLGRGAGGEGQV